MPILLANDDRIARAVASVPEGRRLALRDAIDAIAGNVDRDGEVSLGGDAIREMAGDDGLLALLTAGLLQKDGQQFRLTSTPGFGDQMSGQDFRVVENLRRRQRRLSRKSSPQKDAAARPTQSDSNARPAGRSELLGQMPFSACGQPVSLWRGGDGSYYVQAERSDGKRLQAAVQSERAAVTAVKPGNVCGILTALANKAAYEERKHRSTASPSAASLRVAAGAAPAVLGRP